MQLFFFQGISQGGDFGIYGESLAFGVVVYPAIILFVSIIGTIKSKSWFQMPLITFFVLILFFSITGHGPDFKLFAIYMSFSLIGSIFSRLYLKYRSKFLIPLLVVIGLGLYFVFSQYNARPPVPLITVNDQNVTVVQGSYCWEVLITTTCAEEVSPPELINFQYFQPVELLPESPVKIEFNNKPIENTLRAHLWVNNEKIETIQLNNNVLTAPKAKGVYIYEITARWKNGNSSYVFVMQVK